MSVSSCRAPLFFVLKVNHDTQSLFALKNQQMTHICSGKRKNTGHPTMRSLSSPRMVSMINRESNLWFSRSPSLFLVKSTTLYRTIRFLFRKSSLGAEWLFCRAEIYCMIVQLYSSTSQVLQPCDKIIDNTFKEPVKLLRDPLCAKSLIDVATLHVFWWF